MRESALYKIRGIDKHRFRVALYSNINAEVSRMEIISKEKDPVWLYERWFPEGPRLMITILQPITRIFC